jgi:spermidine synthase
LSSNKTSADNSTVVSSLHQHGKPLWIFLLITAVVCGGLIMVIEVLGSRVIGPFFGVSLFVWTSLITVTMIALATGYGVGGMLSDRRESPAYLYGIILLSSIFVLLVPVLKGPVLKACVPLGLRGGAFTSTLLLFGPSLFLLGCVSPYLAKIATHELHKLGRVVGGLYALSTVGSTVGTVLTGFVLIAFLGVDNIFLVIGVMLIVLSVVYFVLFEKRYWTAALLILPALLYHPAQHKEVTRPDGTKVSMVHKHDSYYGEVKVVDYSYGPKHVRELLIDGMIQGGIDMTNRLSLYEYSYYIQFLSDMLNPGGKTCLAVGLGTGVVPRWFEQQGVRCDVVDIDPEVIQVAKKYFYFGASGQVVAQDARYYLTTTQKHYDYIVLDVFNGDVTPAHLLSIEALQLLKQRLAPHGVVAINLIGSLKQHTFMTASVVKTLQAVFDQVELYPTYDVMPNKGIGNLILITYQGEPRQLRPASLKSIDIHPRLEKPVRAQLGTRFNFPANTPAMVLTDDYNPIDFYDSWLREYIRRGLLQGMDWDVLIG